MGESDKGPRWFKIYKDCAASLEVATAEDAGKALKAVMIYFITREETPLTGGAAFVYRYLKEGANEAIQSYNQSVQYGYKGSNKRYQKEDQPEWI